MTSTRRVQCFWCVRFVCNPGRFMILKGSSLKFSFWRWWNPAVDRQIREDFARSSVALSDDGDHHSLLSWPTCGGSSPPHLPFVANSAALPHNKTETPLFATVGKRGERSAYPRLIALVTSLTSVLFVALLIGFRLLLSYCLVHLMWVPFCFQSPSDLI